MRRPVIIEERDCFFVSHFERRKEKERWVFCLISTLYLKTGPDRADQKSFAKKTDSLTREDG